MALYLVRHTPTLVPKGICYGQSDVELNLHLFDFKTIASQLPTAIDAIYSSPLNRCALLANSLKTEKTFDGSIVYDHRIKELNFGEWEMKRWDDIDQNHLTQWMDNYIHLSPPHGESYLTMVERVNAFYQHIKEACKNQNSVVVTHAGVVRCFYAILHKIELKKTFNIKIDFGSVHQIIS